jgi:energy-coupling factor transporter ATP-binding protein EcfA2
VQILNDFRPWSETLRGELTIAELLARDTLSTDAAATLWWAIEHGASVFVTAGPPGAGKSTVANALLQFLPEDAHLYVTSGGWDRLEVPSAPGPVYLLVNELSAHMPMYLCGAAARRAFDLLQNGSRMLGTLHARSAAEAVRVMCFEADLERAEIVSPFMFAVLSAGWSGREIVRRVVELGFLAPGGDLTVLSTPGPDGLKLDPVGAGALAEWSGLTAEAVQDAVADHASRLSTSPSLP